MTTEEADGNRDELLTLLSYDPSSGALTWAEPIGNLKSGEGAGYINTDGYRYVRFRGKKYLAHRLCWRLHFGSDVEIIDHANMDKADNRISNLRLATIAENNRNREKQSNNTSGFKGVSFNKGSGKFQARIAANKVRRSLGYFSTAESAADAYRRAAKEDHNEFARS